MDFSVNSNNEIVPGKELDPSYTIPRRKRAADSFGAEFAHYSQQAVSSQYPNVKYTTIQSPVASSYYNYYYANQQAQPVSGPDSDNLMQRIAVALEKQRERPKTYKPPSIMKETIPDLEDESLPKDLLAMFQPLYCKLCSAQFSSNVMAKMHYKSKNHEKKIRLYLVEYSERTGEPLHKRAKISQTKSQKNPEEDNDPRYFHCEVCDLPLTGKLHAESHYMGKNHRSVLAGKKPPTGKGYYNADGKWVRLPKETKVELADGQDTFGLDFRKAEASTAATTAAAATGITSVVASNLRCEICNVGATCQKQLEMHIAGQKHQKKLKQLGLSSGEGLPAKKDKKLEEAVDMLTDFSSYRTPSGHYYCDICNAYMNSDIQIKQHLTSKKHLSKIKNQSELPNNFL